MKISKGYWVIIVVLLFAGAWAVAGFAQANYPEGVEVFEIPSGHWCVLIEGDVECYCPCEVTNACEPTTVPTDEPKSTPTPTPTRVNPTDTPVPTKTTKTSCNRGLGNGAENCDPGNSGGKPGAAGEENE